MRIHRFDIFGDADLAVIELLDERLGVLANRVEHLADFEIAVADVDVLDVVAHQLIDGAHVFDRVGDRHGAGLVDVPHILQEADQLGGRVLLSRQSEFFQDVDGFVEILCVLPARGGAFSVVDLVEAV
jgi:hypothetical protein